MRFAYPLFLFALFGLVVGIWAFPLVLADPKVEGVKFVQAVESGDLVRAVKHFGSNACRCPLKGGWVSYLIYKSGQEQNLAFMVGHPVSISAATATPFPNDKKSLLPWQQPEDSVVDVPLNFDPQKYMPLFLPIKMAYGLDITEKELNEFLADPDKDSWKGFTLRLRPSLAKGAIDPPAVNVPESMRSDFKALLSKDEPKTAKKTDQATSESIRESDSQKSDVRGNDDTKSDITQEDVKKVLGAQAVAYLQPKDAGRVLRINGTAMASAEVAGKLPRLKSATLRLHVVRRGQLHDWTIYHFGLVYPVLLLADGHELALAHSRRPE